MENKKEGNGYAQWGKKINWKKRVKAVCKPCWELKYCPYGPLVEDFPLKEKRDDKSCRIFGHDCPVFTMAEPFTETKELRNISRQIPRVTQFRVLKRENQICSVCGKSVKDDDIEFDHVIPWSKGGSSEENNIRLLCSSCNRKRGKKFEKEYLVESFIDHLTEPDDDKGVWLLRAAVAFGHDFKRDNKRAPTAQDYADHLADGELTAFEDIAVNYFSDVTVFFQGKRPYELSTSQFNALKFRWGFKTGGVHTIKDTVKQLGIDLEDYFLAERNLVQRLGIRIKETKNVLDKWKKL
ncbi:HNH endonuclease [Ohtaekwangia koreensis]|uniref:HNH endonuclease n=1 Tax=Ohtaekwangia koreensis TaxID=688867 RepID=A0A1T5MG57_9BACT|nr:HNH endonuclease signature motif containing protein [Ohtaekwangia koreensis]SKC86849.1 HNH endonuclease [Ohtaekwangia koreensis]